MLFLFCRLCAQFVYFVVDMAVAGMESGHLGRVPVAVVVITCVWPVLALVSLELVKKREIK